MSARKIRSFFRKYFALTKIECQQRLAHPIDIILEIFFLLFIFTLLFFIYRATGKVTAIQPTEILTFQQSLWIVFLVNISASFAGKGIPFWISQDVLSGQISYQLARPYSYVLFYFTRFLGGNFITKFFCGLPLGILLCFLIKFPDVQIISLLIGFAMLLLGMILNFLIQLCIGLCAFWLDSVDPLRWVYTQIVVVLGGGVIPIAYFPPSLRTIISCLPFSNIAYGGAIIMVGCSTTDSIFYCVLQLFWIVVMIFVARYIFNKGIKHVTIGGG